MGMAARYTDPMPQRMGAFESSLYDRCQTPACKNVTQSSTGYCEQCRTYTCGFPGCGVTFVSKQRLDAKRARCSQCRRVASRRA